MEKEPILPSEPFPRSPHLDDAIRDAAVESEIEGGADLEKLEVGRTLEVETQNTIYTIERREGGFYISDNKGRWSHPIPVKIAGSRLARHSSSLKSHYVGRGLYLEFTPIEDNPEYKVYVTSAIKDVHELP